MINNEYPRCSETETWDYIIRYEETKNLRWKFIKELAIEMIKAKLTNVCVNDIFDMIEDILQYLENDDSDEYETSQELIEMRDLFRGYIVKVCKGVDFSYEKYHSLNKILVRCCVQFYKECWLYINKHFHKPNK